MERRSFLRMASAAVGVAAGFGISESRAEFSVGIGDLAESTSQASSKLHDGLSTFERMMGALDVKNVSGADVFRESAINGMLEAATMYDNASTHAGNRYLVLIPQNDQERAENAYFQQNAPRYGIKMPVSQKDLLIATARIVREQTEALRSLELSALASDLKARQALVTKSARMQYFLVCVTTMLRAG